MGQLSQAQAASTKKPVVCTGTTAQTAAVMKFDLGKLAFCNFCGSFLFFDDH